MATLATAANTVGRCHICSLDGVPIEYCDLCDHWFCTLCQDNWLWRGLEFVKELVGGRGVDCCGPR